MAGDLQVAEDAYSWPTPDPNDINIHFPIDRHIRKIYISVPFGLDLIWDWNLEYVD